MKLMLKHLAALTLALTTTSAMAVPVYLVTHNNTDVESNAYVNGTIPSPYPTSAGTTRQIYWNMVRIACYGHTSNGKCSAVIKMATDTAEPVDVGVVSMDLDTGVITPSQISGNGYTFTVVGIGEAILTKN